jgi:signal-transduction protein with cAMP-binding, CBS, and nucleotidyltransferase domain
MGALAADHRQRTTDMICPNCNFDNVPGSEFCRNCLNDLTEHDRPAAQDRVERCLMEETVGSLIPRSAVTLPMTALVGEAIQKMLACDIGAVLIVADDGQLLGIFSERDLLTKVVDEPNYATKPVRQFMTANPEAVRETDTLAFVLHKMDSGGYRHLPVLKNGRPLGMISVRDMLRHITQLCKDR